MKKKNKIRILPIVLCVILINSLFVSVSKATTIGTINSSIVSTYEWDTARGMYPDMMRVNNTNYYIIVSDADSNGKEGVIQTILVYANNGTISHSNISWFKFDSTTEGVYPSICHIEGTHTYAVAYADSIPKHIIVFTINVSESTGEIAAGITSSLDLGNPTTFDSGNHVETNMINVYRGVYVVAYNSTLGLELKTFYTNNRGVISGSANASLKVNDSMIFPHMEKVDNDTIALVYQGDASSAGYLRTYNISSAGTITYTGNEWEFDTANGCTPYIKHVVGDAFAIAYNGITSNLFLKTVKINSSGYIIKRWVDSSTVDDVGCQYPYLTCVSGNVYALTYQGADYDGYVSTMMINNSGYVSDNISWLEFDTADDQYFAPITWIGNDYYLIVYSGTDTGGDSPATYDGCARTINITTTTIVPVVVDTAPKNGSTNLPLSFNWSCYINNRNQTYDYVINCDGQIKSESNVNDGTKILPLSGLSYNTRYTVYVNSTHGTSVVHNTYQFTTIKQSNSSLLNLINQKKSIMAFVAHCDDEYMFPGLFAYAKSKGCHTWLISCINVSQTGPNVPKDERIAANNWFNHTFLDAYIYFGMMVSKENWTRICNNITLRINLYKPDILIVNTPGYGYHDVILHKWLGQMVLSVYKNLTYHPTLYWIVNSGQDLDPTKTEMTMYPPSDIISSDLYSSYFGKTAWDLKIESWERYSLSMGANALEALLKNETMINNNNRCEYFYDTNITYDITVIRGGFGVSAVIKNIGIIDQTQVPWSINLAGGLVLLKGKSGKIDIKSGAEATVRAMVFGFGKPTITVTVGKETKTATGILILFFVVGVK